MQFINRVILFFLIFSCSKIVTAQGCSDAGACSINSFKHENVDSIPSFKNYFKIGLNSGAAEENITVNGGYIEYGRKLSNKFTADVRLTAASITGNTISVSGLADIFTNISYKISDDLSVTAGVKIPVSHADETKDNFALPMDYQPGLGSFDVIAGVGYKISVFYLALAYQHPLTKNENEFIRGDHPSDSFNSFYSTRKFARAPDLLLRFSYPYKFAPKFVVTPGLLPVYHISNDKYTDLSGKEIEIKDSQGLTLNANLFVDYHLTDHSSLQLGLGAPLLVRDERPEGLTRKYVINLEAKIGF